MHCFFARQPAHQLTNIEHTFTYNFSSVIV